MGTALHPHAEGYNSWERSRGHKRHSGPRPCPDPGLEAYLTSQTNAKEKADARWGWEDLKVPRWRFKWKDKGLSIHCACNTGKLPSSELG